MRFSAIWVVCHRWVALALALHSAFGTARITMSRVCQTQARWMTPATRRLALRQATCTRHRCSQLNWSGCGFWG